MSTTVLREEIVTLDYGGMQFEVETRGELKLMPRNARMVFAIFGAFERTDNSTLLYTSSVEDDWFKYYDSQDHLIGSMDSEYLDDLHALRAGNIETYEFR